MENKKYIIFIVIAFITGMAVMFCVMFFTKEKCVVCEKCDIEEKTEENTLTKSQEEMFDILFNIAKEMYSKKEYVNLDKNDNDVYIASLNDIKELEYDVSYLEHCVQDIPMIFFDTEFKMSQTYEKDPLQISITCGEE